MLLNRVEHWLEDGLAKAQKPLELGAGTLRRIPNITTVDIQPQLKPDHVMNLNQFPWTLQDEEFDFVILSNILEHIKDIVPFFQELHRISKPGTLIKISCPHFSNPCAYADPTHHHCFSIFALDSLCKVEERPITDLVGKIAGCHIKPAPIISDPLFNMVNRMFCFTPHMYLTLTPLIANFCPGFFEVYCAPTFKAWAVLWHLEVIK